MAKCLDRQFQKERGLGLKTLAASATGRFLHWGLANIARRPGANLPGKAALAIDPQILDSLRGRARLGSIMTVGTNGKTTANNLVADILEQSGLSVICNRTGANLNSGITSALMLAKPADWAVLECDELWFRKVAPSIQPRIVLLLNLFRDQLDRCGEIDLIQDSIIAGLRASPEAVLAFNADDPLCAYVADSIPNEKVAFGLGESLELMQNKVADATMCQRCSHMFRYEWRQYGQLGKYSCPNCGFARPELDFEATNVRMQPHGIELDVSQNASNALEMEACTFPLSSSMTGSYVAYNLTGVSAACALAGVDIASIQTAVRDFNPKNGRLQEYSIDGHWTLLNLAKNPTGFNQNLRIATSDERERAAAFFINDKVVDGHDISWIWDIDFEELASRENVKVYAGGIRRLDLQVRLKYAGIDAKLIDGIGDVFEDLDSMGASAASIPVYAIANYTALPDVKAALDRMASA